MGHPLETVIKVKVIPRASRTEIVGKENDLYRVRITTPPVEGKGNKALIALLSEKLGIPKREIEIVSGKAGRLKTVRIKGMSDAGVTKTLEAQSKEPKA